MPKIVKGPVPKTVVCNTHDGCRATIEYLPEDVLAFGCGGSKVKCPRPKCPGWGIINSGSYD